MANLEILRNIALLLTGCCINSLNFVFWLSGYLFRLCLDFHDFICVNWILILLWITFIHLKKLDFNLAVNNVHPLENYAVTQFIQLTLQEISVLCTGCPLGQFDWWPNFCFLLLEYFQKNRAVWNASGLLLDLLEIYAWKSNIPSILDR